jgi:hypothetical protein
MADFISSNEIRDKQVLVLKSVILCVAIYFCLFDFVPRLVKFFCREDILEDVKKKQQRDPILEFSDVMPPDITCGNKVLSDAGRSKVPRPIDLLSPKVVSEKLYHKLDETCAIVLPHNDAVNISDNSISLHNSTLKSPEIIQSNSTDSRVIKKQSSSSVLKRRNQNDESLENFQNYTKNLDKEIKAPESRASVILSQDIEFEMCLQRDILNMSRRNENVNAVSSTIKSHTLVFYQKFIYLCKLMSTFLSRLMRGKSTSYLLM